MEQTALVGVLYRGTQSIEHVRAERIHIDGSDATDTAINMYEQLDAPCSYIMTDGITAGGFNMLDIQAITQACQTPVIAVTRTDPDFESIYTALEQLSDRENRKDTIKAAGDVYRTTIQHAPVFYQTAGINQKQAAAVIDQFATESVLPEPIRTADLIGDGIETVIA